MFGVWSPVAAAQTYEEPLPIPTGATSQVALSQSNILVTCTPPAYFQPNPTVWTVSSSEVQLGGLPAADVVPAAGHLLSVTVPSSLQPGQGFFISWTGNTDCVSFNGIMYFAVSAPTPPPPPPPPPQPTEGGPPADDCPAATRTLALVRNLQLRAGIARGEAIRLFAAAEESNANAAERFGTTLLQKLKEIASEQPQSVQGLLAAMAGGNLNAPAAAEWARRLVGGGHRQHQLRKLFQDFFHATRPSVHGVPVTVEQRAFNYRVEKLLGEALLKLVAPLQRAGASLAQATVIVSGIAAKLVPWISGAVLADAYGYYLQGLRHLYEARQQSALADRLTQEARAAAMLARRQALDCRAAKTKAGRRAAAAAAQYAARSASARSGLVARATEARAHRRLPRVRRLSVTLRFPLPASGALERLFDRELRAFAHVDAGTLALRRSIVAGRRKDTKAERRQLAFAARRFRVAARLLAQLPRLRRSAAGALGGAGVAPFEIAVAPEVLSATTSALGVPAFVRALAPAGTRSSLGASPTGAPTIAVDPARIAAADTLDGDADWARRLRELAGERRQRLVLPRRPGRPRQR